MFSRVFVGVRGAVGAAAAAASSSTSNRQRQQSTKYCQDTLIASLSITTNRFFSATSTPTSSAAANVKKTTKNFEKKPVVDVVDVDDEVVRKANELSDDDDADFKAHIEQERLRREASRRATNNNDSDKNKNSSTTPSTPSTAIGRRLVPSMDMVRAVDNKGVLQMFSTLDEAHAAARAAGSILRQTNESPPTYAFSKRPLVVRNTQITHPQLIVISDAGVNLGSMRLADGIRRATAAKLDLILVSDSPPTARITDYNKYRIEQEKNKKPHQSTRIKQVRFGAFSDEHDIETRFNQVVGFLEASKQVRILVHFKRARDYDYDGAMATLNYLKTQLQPYGSTDGATQIAPGKSVSMMFSPKKKK